MERNYFFNLLMNRPAWNSKSAEKAVEAAVRLKDETMLSRVAKEAWCWQARLAAVELISDQSVLAYVAENDTEWRVRFAAIKQLADKSVREVKLMDLIHALDRKIKNAQDKMTKISAYEALMVIYQWYGKAHGE